jgi:hypothetical protein
MKCKQLIMGHTHPTIMLTDRLGYKMYESCWLRGETDKDKLVGKYPVSKPLEIIVMPAFNQLCGGIAANQEGVAGPIGKIMDVKNARVYLLDGSFLGRVKDIK